MSLDVYLICEHCESKLFDANITHNLGKIAELAGIYKACWRPEELGAKFAKDIAPILKSGLEALTADPAKFIAENPENGWGSYENFVPWVKRYYEACMEFPNALIRASR